MVDVKMKKYLPLFLGLASVLGLNIYFRSFPIYFPQFKKQATQMIEQSIRQEAIQGISKKFPDFNSLAQDKLIDNLIADYKNQNKKNINDKINQLYLQIKDKYQDSSGQTYLMELDCWHWARYVDNINRTGHPGDEVIKGKQWDKLMLAPTGAYMAWNNFLFYFSSFAYKLFCLFKPIPLNTFLFYLPFLFITAFIIVLYLFSYRQGGNIAAIIACLIAGLSAIFIPRSCAGWFDCDILNLLFPILVIWPYLSAYEKTSLKQRLFRIGLSAFWVGLFCAIWLGWWFIFLIIILYEIYSLTHLFLVYKIEKEMDLNAIKERGFFLASFVLLSFFWILILCGPEPLRALYRNVKESLILNKPLISSIWPNVYSTVGELKPFNFNEIANSSGNKAIFISSVLAMCLFLWRALTDRSHKTFKREVTIIMTLWFMAMFFACFKGVRFTMFLLVPTGIFLGRLVNEAYEYIKIRHKKWKAAVITAMIVTAIAFPVCKKAYNTANSILPLIDDAWYNVLNIIKARTPQEAILNSWWDFGDWFKVVAGRRVIFDGQSQNTPQAYWMAKALLSGSEEEAVGILRMLNNGGNRAFEVINSHVRDPLKSILLLESIIPSSPETAGEKLSQFLPTQATQDVLKLLFDKPAKAYFIVDPSMQYKIPAISYLGNWDFDKVYMVQNFNKTEKNQLTDYLIKLGRNNQQVQRIYQEAFLISEKNLDNWLSHRSQFYSVAVNGVKKGEEVFFDNGFVYNPNQQTIYSGNHQTPQSLFVFFKQDNLVEIIYPASNMGLSVLVFKVGEETYQSILLNRELANSLFVRLYFLGGMGLRHFKPFIEAGGGNDYIRTFEILWD
jgi:hypothetical protein